MRKWLPAVLIFATLAFSIAVYNRLPERMVIHWNLSGEPDDYGSRERGAFLLPLVALGMWGLLIALPKLDPRSANFEKFRDTYDVFVLAVVAVMCVLRVGVVGSALGWPLPVARLAPISIGALFVILGNGFHDSDPTSSSAFGRRGRSVATRSGRGRIALADT